MNFLSAENIAKLLFTLTLFVVCVTIYYFTLIPYIETRNVISQMNILADSFTQDIKSFEINIPVNKIVVPDLSAEDAKVEANNKKLIIKAVTAVSIFTAVSLTICCLLWYKYRFPMGDLLKLVLILVFFVLITETFYIVYISGSFRTLDPNAVKLNMVNQLRNF